jgi:lipopolysaccharide export system protein LptC
MTISPKDQKFYLLVVAVSIASWIAIALLTDEAEHETIAVRGAEYFSNDYTKWEMDETGKLKNKLVAEKVTHYDDDTTHSIKPVMYFYNDKTPPWVVKAETGVLSADGKDMFLNGKSVVSRAKAEKSKELIINTSNLRVKPETSYAETDEWAELLSPPNVTTGTGMKMVFVSPVHLELLANVKGKYETN